MADSSSFIGSISDSFHTAHSLEDIHDSGQRVVNLAQKDDVVIFMWSCGASIREPVCIPIRLNGSGSP
ncbi:hypothetical protein AN958_04434 [Leucoagaricus sp. SymC.cos]|nr:hypothetical protein AN958_04434 [Leucoagaricus sp. SymC.cos]